MAFGKEDAQAGGANLDESPFEDELVVEDVQDEASPSQSDILKQFEELKKANEELKSRADQSSALKSSFDSLGERLEKSAKAQVQAPAPIPQREAGETMEQFKERINRTYLEDPFSALQDFSNRMIGGAVQTLAEQNLRLQRKMAYIESPDKDFVSKHRDEIEAELDRIPVDQQIKDPSVVNRTIDSVRARHMDEIVAQKVAEEIAKLSANGSLAPAATQRAPVGTSEVPLTPQAPSSATAGGRRVQVTPLKKSRILAQMRLEGMPPEKYNDYVGWLVEDGEFDSI